MDPPPHPKPAKQNTTINIENSLGHPLPRMSVLGRSSEYYFFTKSFFFKIPNLFNRPTVAPFAAESCR